MKYVKQREIYGCGIACIAMILEKPYEEIRAMFPPSVDKWINTGISHMYWESILFQEGFISQTFYEVIGHTQEKRKQWAMEPFAPIHIISVVTKSDNVHAVVMSNNKDVYDPNKEGIYKLADYNKVMSMTGVWKIPLFIMVYINLLDYLYGYYGNIFF